MKILLSILMAAAISTSLFAADKLHKAQLQSDMRLMLNALLEAQTAGFYNNKNGLIASVTTLKKGLKSLKSMDAKLYLPKEYQNTERFAKKRVSMIEMYADDFIISVKDDNMDDAFDDFVLLQKQCTSCHIRLRKNF